jgi:hypothetical protein
MAVPAPTRAVPSDPTLHSSWLSRRGGREETAQVVVRRSISLAAAGSGTEVGGAALGLLRVANNDPATLQHALIVCRSLARDDPADERLNDAARLLERVIEFLGVPIRRSDAPGATPRLLAPPLQGAPAMAGSKPNSRSALS